MTEALLASAKRCREQADLLVVWARQAEGVALDYSIESLERLDVLISRRWADGDASPLLVVAVGCYVGETLVTSLGGHWSWKGMGGVLDEPHVVGSNGERVHLNVLSKAAKRFRYGDDDSLAHFARVASLHARGELPVDREPPSGKRSGRATSPEEIDFPGARAVRRLRWLAEGRIGALLFTQERAQGNVKLLRSEIRATEERISHGTGPMAPGNSPRVWQEGYLDGLRDALEAALAQTPDA